MNFPIAAVVASLALAVPVTVASGDRPVTFEPLEVVDAEFETVAPHDWDRTGWGVRGVEAEKVAGLLLAPDTASEWWDGRVLQLPPMGAAFHPVAASLEPGDRVMISFTARVSEPGAGEGGMAVGLMVRAEPINRMASSAPIAIDAEWTRYFTVVQIPSVWPPEGDAHLQLINSGSVDVQIDKVALARVRSDEAGFTSLFNGRDLTGWTGNTQGYGVENGSIRTFPDRAGGNLYSEKEFDDFVLRFAFRLPPGANNGIAIRAPLTGDAAYEGMEVQVLENSHPKYAGLQPWQFHGSVYGISPALRGYQVPPGEWNHEEIRVDGRKIRVVLNGKVINEVDLDAAMKEGTLSGREHPGASRSSGHIGFCGHGDVAEFKDLRLRPLSGTPGGAGR